jgi:hypothetical protein
MASSPGDRHGTANHKSTQGFRIIEVRSRLASNTLRRFMAETLLNSLNPLRLFAASFDLHVTQPIIRLQREMWAQNRAKELKIIKALDRERALMWYRRDVRWGLLHAA